MDGFFDGSELGLLVGLLDGFVDGSFVGWKVGFAQNKNITYLMVICQLVYV